MRNPASLPETQLPLMGVGAQVFNDFRSWGLDSQFSSIFMTGASGLVGRWVLSTLDALNLVIGQRSDVFVLVRNESRARQVLSNLSSLNLHFISRIEIERTIAQNVPEHIWHFAAETGSSSTTSALNSLNADCALSIEICRAVDRSNRPTRILYTSSGAVYGRDSAPIAALPLQTPISDTIDFQMLLYGHGKVTSEMLFGAMAERDSVTVNIARLFSFIGPLMPLTSHFAMGNFLDAAKSGRKIVLNSTGEALRSWMYLGDLARMLLLLASQPSSNIVDVGSEESMSVREAAHVVAEIAGLDVEVGSQHNPSGSSMNYVPDLTALRSLGPLPSVLSLREAISTTLEWLMAEGGGFEPPRSLHP